MSSVGAAGGDGFGRVWVLVLACGLLAVVLSSTGVLGQELSQAVDDLGQLAAGAFAAGCCGRTWRRAAAAGLVRSSWLWRALLFAGMTGWTCGQGVWTWYQLVAARELPSPSLADVGYFALPLFAVPALLALPAAPAPGAGRAMGPGPRSRAERRGRWLLAADALVIVGSLFLLTWSTALGAVVRAGAPTLTAFLIAVGYPVTDLIMVVIVLLITVFRRPRRPLAVVLLGAGLVALSVSDSLFLYVVSIGATGMPPIYNIGFLTGPLLIGLAALAPDPASRRTGPTEEVRAAVWFTLLPYVPLAAVGLLVIIQLVVGLDVDSTETYGLLVLVGIVLVRQLLTLLENVDLLQRVQDGQDRLRHQAFHDWLTGLPNRALFRDRLEQAVARQRRDRGRLALLFCDLDDFKRVNDSYGHAAGDELLRAVAERLRSCVRSGDTVARLGGDEFAVIVEDDRSAPLAVGQRILDAVAEPVVLPFGPHAQRASIGMVLVEPGGQVVTVDGLQHQADTAMYAAKRAGKGRLVRYAPGMASQPDTGGEATELADLLAAALADAAGAGASLTQVYQPIVRLSDELMVAAEALIRWHHPVSGSAAPELVVRVAEDAGLIDVLEDLVLDRACADMTWLRAGRHPTAAVHVNITPSRLTDGQWPARVRTALERYRLPGDALVLEVTETGRIGDFTAAADTLQAVRRLGVKIALDDFGAGNSNLNHLLRMPIDILKLDRALVEGGNHPDRAEAITAGATQIARRLDIPIVAEGIEQVDQAARLAGLGCLYGQGYLYSEPVSSLALRTVRGVGTHADRGDPA
jgi:diguanylate cyclase